MIQGRFSSLTVFFAASPHWPGLANFLFSAYSRDAKEEITTCKRFEKERIRILNGIYMPYFIYFTRLLLDFPLVKAL